MSRLSAEAPQAVAAAAHGGPLVAAGAAAEHGMLLPEAAHEPAATGRERVTAWANTPTVCHLLHLCLAILAGVGLVMAWVALRFRIPHGASLSPLARVRSVRSPPARIWGPVELCVCRT
ncbi:hypothetical protein GCM10020369_44050 [Cryptosporangium minutisporangium]|uniref:Uncharacterized protein n=1 Tax=Cryptosporangium minutisporangium TaxID=113569 RepID=A0ABP6T2Z1_9ACTN